jgi:pimeloyl-ACP methyl ester carboxylesterase
VCRFSPHDGRRTKAVFVVAGRILRNALPCCRCKAGSEADEEQETLGDLVVSVLGELVPGGVRRGDLRCGSRTLRWVDAGSGGPTVVFDAGLAEPGSLAWAAVLPAVAEQTRVIAYDRAGVGASDPVSPLTVEGEVADLAALLIRVGNGRCVLVGHCWGGLLAQLVAFSHPDLVAGLVLVDPAHEETLAAVPWPLRAVQSAQGYVALLLYRLGLVGRVVRSAFRPFARRVTDDRQLQGRILDAYASCFSKRTQVRMLRDENRLVVMAIPHIRQVRATSALPDVPVIVLSATKGLPEGLRGRWTALQASLAETAAGQHLIAHDTGHAIHQERPEQVRAAVIRVVENIRHP